MEKKLRLVKEITLLVVSFVVPFVLLVIIFSVNGISLAGYKGDTIMMIDMQSQYISYLRYYRDLLLNDSSIIYTNAKVFGGDFQSIFAYYLSSPFNFFIVFVKPESIPLFVIWTNILKMSFASFNFYLLMRFSRKFSYTHILCAIGYGLVSYSFIYLSNYMWLDGVMILPLVALGLEFLSKKKYLWVYPLAIAYSLMTSWYIGFMICIFAVLYFIYVFVRDFKTENKEFLMLLLRFAIFSLVGGLLSSTYWLTAFIHLSGTKATSQAPGLQWFSLSSFISGLLENNYSTSSLIRQNNSYISMFVGIVPLVFFITYFFNKEYKLLKERLPLFVIFCFYFLMSINTISAALMHGGREPTWFPGRYSFIIAFIVCYVASLSLEESHKLNPLYYIAPAVLGAGAILIVKYMKHSRVLTYYPLSTASIIMYFVTIAFGALISGAYLLFTKKEKLNNYVKYVPYALPLLIVIQCVSIYRGGNNVIKVNKFEKQYQAYETYSKDEAYQKDFDALKKYDKDTFNSPFYRMESTFNRPGQYNQINNNPMFYSYNGLSNYSSSSKKDVESYMKKLGYHYNGFYAQFNAGSTYSMSSLLGIKYLLEDQESEDNIHPYYLDYETFDKIELKNSNLTAYYNKNAVNLGFSSDKTSVHYINEGSRKDGTNIYWFDKFEYQNQIFRTFNNSIDEDVFKPLPITSMVTSIEYEEDSYHIKTFKNVKQGDTIRISFSIPEEAKQYPLYFSEKDETRNILYMLEGYYMPVNTYHKSGIQSFRYIKSRLTHYLTIRFDSNFNSITLRPELYYEDLSVAKKYLTSLNEQSFIIDKVENNMFNKAYRGHINITDNNKDLIFTLPQEKGINVYVDNKKVKTFTKFNVFTAIDLSQFSKGEHNIIIQYQDNGLVAATPLFLVTLLGFVPLVIYYDRMEKLLLKKLGKKKKLVQ